MEEPRYPPKRYLIAYAAGLLVGFFPLTQVAPVDELFPAALALSGILLVLTSLFAGRGIYRYQPLATFPHYVLNATLFSGIFGAVMTTLAVFRLVFG